MAQKFLTDIEVTRGLVDSDGDLGVAGQVLSSTGTGTNWITNEANSTVVYQDGFTGDNSTVDFTLSVSVTDENVTQVYIDGVYQTKDTYSVSNTTLTFSTAPPLNADIEVITFSTATTADDLQAGVMIIPVKNTHTASIAKGEPVYITGNVGSSARLQIAPADASNSAKMPAAGLLLQTLAVNAEGYVVTGGYLRNLTTDTIDGTSTSSNDTVYVKSGGGLTMTKPTGSNLIQNIAKVARVASGNAGSLLVSSILRTNDVPNITNDYFWLGNSSGVATPTEFTSSVRGLISVSGNALSYNSSTGVITSNYEESPTFTGNVVIDGTLDVNGSEILVGTNNTRLAENNLRFKAASDAYIDQNTVSQAIRFRTSSSSSLDTTPIIIAAGGITTFSTDVHVGGSSAARFKSDGTNTYVDAIPASSSIVFRNSGAVEKARIDSSGRLGIGTTSPSAKLEIEDSGADLLDLTRTSIGTYRLAISASDKFSIYDVGAASDRLVIDSSGNVGIGTTSPNNALEVAGNSSTTHRIRINNTGTGTSTLAFVQGTTFKSWVEYNNATGNFDVWQYTNNPMRFATNNTERMRITSGGYILTGGRTSVTGTWGVGSIEAERAVGAFNSNKTIYLFNNGATIKLDAYDYGASSPLNINIGGNGGDVILNGDVGIGVTSPAHKLDVAGSGKFQPGIADGDALVTIAQTNSNAYVHAGLKINAGNTNPFYIYQSGSSNTLRFNYNSLSDAGGQMVITDGGNVGIGNTSPTAKLEITGSNGTNIFRGNFAGSADIFMGFDSANPYLILQDNSNITTHLFQSNVNNYIINSNVGIGVTSPSFKTHFRGGSNTEETVLKIDKSSYSDTGGHTTILGLGNEPAGWAKGGIGYERTGSYDRGKIHFLQENTSNTDTVTLADSVMTITPEGYVGIGTSSPFNTLDVRHGTNNRAVFSDSSSYGDNVLIGLNDGGGEIGFGIAGSSLSFYTNVSERMTINNSGNVGIGTTSPARHLDIREQEQTYSGVLKLSSAWTGSNVWVERLFAASFIRQTQEVGVDLLSLGSIGGNSHVLIEVSILAVAATSQQSAKITFFAGARQTSGGGYGNHYVTTPVLTAIQGSSISGGTPAWQGNTLIYTTFSQTNYTRYQVDFRVTCHDYMNITFEL